MRHARRGCRTAHQIRLHKNTHAKEKLTTSHTTPRTAAQLTSATTIIQYHGSCCPASTMKVSTTATVRLGSRSGLMKSIMRQSQFRSVFTFNLRSSRLCSSFGRSYTFRLFGRILAEVPNTGKGIGHSGDTPLSRDKGLLSEGKYDSPCSRKNAACRRAAACTTILRQQATEDARGVSGPTTPSLDKPGYGDTLVRQVFCPALLRQHRWATVSKRNTSMPCCMR